MANHTPSGRTLLFLDERMSCPQFHPVVGGLVSVYSTPEPTGDHPNEDAAGVVLTGARRAVFMVADGVGGSPGGRQAAHRVLKTLARTLTRSDPGDGSQRSAILDGIELANRELLATGTGGASTLAVVDMDEDRVRTYHVGDSAVLLLGGRGRIKLQTIDHTPAGFGIEAGLFDEKEAMCHEDRHVVLNVVGSPDMRIDIGPALPFAPRDTLLIASDGLMDNLMVEEIAHILRRGPFRPVSQALIDRARARMATNNAERPSKPDDLTVLLFRKYGLDEP